MKLHTLAAAVAAVSAAVPALAMDLGNGLTFKGFGTVGVMHSSNQDADFVASNFRQGTGAGRSDETSFKVDSKVGGQLDWQASDRLSMSVQALSKQYEDKTWVPRIESAFVKFKALQSLDVRVGRVSPPVYMLSDYINVNYANPWVRPPSEHYGVVPFSNIDGMDLLWRPTTGSVSWLVQPYVGRTKVDFAGGNSDAENKVSGISITASRGDLSLRTGYLIDKVHFGGSSIDTLIGAYSALCAIDPVACGLAHDLNNDITAKYLSFGATWDPGNYFVSGEWAQLKFDSDTSQNAHSWYITSGYRLDKWTPYVSYSKFKIDSSAIYTGSGNATTNAITTAGRMGYTGQGQHTISLGVRYDVMPNVALKAQWDHVKTDCNDGLAGSCGGRFINQSNNFANSSQKADLLSLSVDFVF